MSMLLIRPKMQKKTTAKKTLLIHQWRAERFSSRGGGNFLTEKTCAPNLIVLRLRSQRK